MSALSFTRGAAPTKARAAMAMKARNCVFSLTLSRYDHGHGIKTRKQTAYSMAVHIHRLLYGRANTEADRLGGTPPIFLQRMRVYTSRIIVASNMFILFHD